MDTLKCNHCQRIILLSRIGNEDPEWGYCHSCDGKICKFCYERLQLYGCRFFMKQIELAEEKDHARRHRGY